jgi:ABC-type Fe3+/spermidine/putrescine transport system ATPase subunit
MRTTSIPAPQTGEAEKTSAPVELLSVRSLAKQFGNNVVLRDISLNIADGEFLSVLGESGSGKTTLLRLIAGFERPDSGEIWMGGERLDLLPPYKRRVNTVFQNYALFPHLSVFENVAYSMRVKKTPQREVSARVEQALAMVKMTTFAQASPSLISGGQQQRVALARALVNRPRLLLLDEPLSALDANLRRQMQLELKALQREIGVAFVFVTHDQEEAMVMSDRIALLHAGALEQVATPRQIYTRPATTYAAQFIGQTNLLQVEVANHIAECAGIRWATSEADGPATFSVRPECIVPVLSATMTTAADVVRFRARMLAEVFQGAMQLLQVETASGLRMIVKTAGTKARSSEMDFEFSQADAVCVRDTQHT